ncbi:MAG TPA: hypothetical protein VFL29_02225 [Candidatus Dormibacteraeota bacterium]|nr:hypothetical protein [Candidatus Dormibacteraeota bacterium]
MVSGVDELADMRKRVVVARARLRALLPASRDHEPPADPKTGERWDRMNILGHMAEFPAFWTAELESAMVTGEEFGRRPGSTSRQDAIDGGATVGESELKRRAARGIESILGLLGKLEPADLDRTVTMRGRGEVTLRWALEYLLVGHVVEHCDQLYSLTTTT